MNMEHGWRRADRLRAAAACLLLAPAFFVAGAVAGEPDRAAMGSGLFAGDGHWREVDRIEGLWNVTVTITLCDASGKPTDTQVPGTPKISALALFAANGTFHDTNSANPASRSSGLGEWRRTGWRTYDFAFKFYRFDATNVMPLGSQIVRHSVVLARDGQSYTSRGTAEWFDTNGDPVAPVKTCSTSTATRFE